MSASNPDGDTAGRLLVRLRECAGRFVSGSRLGAELGISRTAVWKHVHALQGEGYGIESTPHKGYRLVHPPHDLSAREVVASLAGNWLGRPLLLLEETDSTNRVAMHDRALGHGAVVAARRQLAGRGRLGRVWRTPPGTLAFSLVLSTPLPPQRATLITLAAALGVADGVRAACGLELDIKWPNDLLWQGRKVAGILTEVRSDPDRVVRAVVGIGLNANTAQDDLPPEVRGRAGSLAQAVGRAVPPSALLARVLDALAATFDALFADPAGRAVDALLDDYRARCVTLGQPVTVTGHDGVARGTALAVDADGSLRVRQADGAEMRVFSGDVTLSGEAVG
ncbi:MAG: biotin--[acetyl-CoA-carboxylase] ligase [Nitrospirae bacterium]|nr:biotin--[acetyl-CoA-carboxylase] ligase [Nitrospirota bacterium]